MKYILALLIFASASAQRPEVISGKLESLKGINAYNVTFTYEGMQIHRYDSEADFLKAKHELRAKKSSEKAEAFIENWYKFRTEKYEPGFIAYFNGRFGEEKSTWRKIRKRNTP